MGVLLNDNKVRSMMYDQATGKVTYGDDTDLAGFKQTFTPNAKAPKDLVAYGTTTYAFKPTPGAVAGNPNSGSGMNADGSYTIPSAGTQAQQGGAANQQGGLMGQFNSLLKERQGVQSQKMSLQEQQLQKINTQKNNTAFQNAFASRSNLVEIMRQLLDTSRRTAAAQQRVFM